MLIIINNFAAKARRSWPIIQKQLDAANITCLVHETTAPGDATTRTRAALRAGVETVVVVGGDGTLSEAAEGFFEFNSDPALLPTQINPAATLAILPTGTGDDFARGLHGRRVPLQEWIQKLLSHCLGETNNSHAIDILYGLCDGFEKPFICLNASTMGIGGETAGRVSAQGKFMRRFSGEFRFVFAALGALATWRERRVRVAVDGQTVADGPMNLVAVANGLYAGGGMMFSPDARIDDGRLDVMTASGLTRANVITELSRIHAGGHLKNPKITIARGTIATIETLLEQDAMPLEADGNVRGVTPARFEVMPQALRFIWPRLPTPEL